MLEEEGGGSKIHFGHGASIKKRQSALHYLALNRRSLRFSLKVQRTRNRMDGYLQNQRKPSFFLQKKFRDLH